MKKFISVLLIVAMMATTFAVIFAGTVTAFAAESNSVAVSEYVSAEKSSISAKFSAAIVWLLDVLFHRSKDAGILSVLMEGIYDIISSRHDVEGFMNFLINSGIVEWVTRVFFPR